MVVHRPLSVNVKEAFYMNTHAQDSDFQIHHLSGPLSHRSAIGLLPLFVCSFYICN